MTTSIIAVAILAIGWPVLIVSSILIMRSTLVFYRQIQRNSIGRLVLYLATAFIVTAYCLAVVASDFLLSHPSESTLLIFFIFIIWTAVVYFTLRHLPNFQTDTININQKYIDQNTTLSAQTKQLEQQVADLEKLNQAMVGRELKMIELKAEISKLQSKNQS